MILVSGTKRSGTSMWMQILRAAGFPIHGEAFPRDWGESIRAANPEGFFESALRRGVYAKTNPDPRTGVFFAPEATRTLVVKVFARGLVRTELPFMDHVVASVRPIDEYVASMERLYAMERAHRTHASGMHKRPVSEVLHMAPALEWWHHNYTLLCDARARGYPLSLISYHAVLRDPERAVAPVLAALGSAHLRRALAHVKPALRTQGASRSRLTDFSDSQRARFHAFFTRVDEGRPFDDAVMRELAQLARELAPRIAAARAALRVHRVRAAAAVRMAQR